MSGVTAACARATIPTGDRNPYPSGCARAQIPTGDRNPNPLAMAPDYVQQLSNGLYLGSDGNFLEDAPQGVPVIESTN